MTLRTVALFAVVAAWLAAGCGSTATQRQPTADGACMPATASPRPTASAMPGTTGAPEIATGYAPKTAVITRSYMVVTAHPLASQAGCQVLKAGGSAVDAAVAAQMVLNLVEPQSSGIGGGGFLMHYDAATRNVTAYDGRETAPAAATANDLRWISDTQRTKPLPSARASGRAIGTPGLLHMLDAAHRDAGRLPWRELFAPVIRIAHEGFAISPRLSAAIAASATDLARDAETRAYFLDADGRAKASGTRLVSPALAATFTALAERGSAAFYGGAIAQDIVDEVADTTGNITAGKTTLADLAAYTSKKRDAICTSYRGRWVVCGMPPPSSGGIAVAQALGMLERFDLAALAPTAVDVHGGQPTVQGVHLVVEAERLAYADRDRYVADTDFVALPGGSPAALLGPAYLAQRAALIRPDRSLGQAMPGDFGSAKPGVPPPSAEGGTTQVTVVDAQGNVVSLTSSIESAFGSFHMTRGGFLLNNQLTDFSATPGDAQGLPIANRLAPGKRPRSSMSPTLVFDAQPDGSRGPFVMATGSPGGMAIIQYVVKALVGTLDWRLDAQQAVSMTSFGAFNHPVTYVGGEHPNVDLAKGSADDPLVSGLRALGHTVNTAAQSSGLASIVRRKGPNAPVLEGGADPRREGVAMGDALRP